MHAYHCSRCGWLSALNGHVIPIPRNEHKRVQQRCSLPANKNHILSNIRKNDEPTLRSLRISCSVGNHNTIHNIKTKSKKSTCTNRITKKTRMQRTKRIIYTVHGVQCSGGEMCVAIDRGCVGGNNIRILIKKQGLGRGEIKKQTWMHGNKIRVGEVQRKKKENKKELAKTHGRLGST